MSRSVITGSLLILLSASSPRVFSAPHGSGDYVAAIKSGKRFRTFRLHVPPKYGVEKPVPLILAFHGSSASASVIERETGLDQWADSMNFLVVYPEGLHRGWNIGECCRYSFMKNIDDVQFARDLIRVLKNNMSVDANRVFATGYSDGGSLAYLLACAHPDQIAAAAGVGSTLYNPLPVCAAPVSIMNIHATGDKNVPFYGKAGKVPATQRGEHTQHSAGDIVQFWVRNDRCSTATVTRTQKVRKEAYSCGVHDVFFFIIEGGEHGWPGGGRGWILSPIPPTDIAASDSILKFFLDHPLRSSGSNHVR